MSKTLRDRISKILAGATLLASAGLNLMPNAGNTVFAMDDDLDPAAELFALVDKEAEEKAKKKAEEEAAKKAQEEQAKAKRLKKWKIAGVTIGGVIVVVGGVKLLVPWEAFGNEVNISEDDFEEEDSLGEVDSLKD